MLTVVEDTVRNHWGNMGGRCSRRIDELRDGDRNHRSCQENLAEALAPHGLSGDLRAEMNILAALSACPADRNATNDGRAKPLGIRVSA